KSGQPTGGAGEPTLVAAAGKATETTVEAEEVGQTLGEAKIVGRVTDRSGKPLAYLDVVCASAKAGWHPGVLQGMGRYEYSNTHRDGRYEIPVPAGPVFIEVDGGARQSVVARLRGRVLDGQGRPVARNVVIIQNWRMGTRTTT